MMRAELADTLTALALGASPDHPHLAVEEVEISLPLIVWMEHGAEGPRILAQPPFSAFHSGFEPVSHRCSFSFASAPADGPARPAQESADPQPEGRPVSAG